jgi:transposase-like protein
VGEEGRDRQRQARWDTGYIAENLKSLERENRELRQANEILSKASAHFAQGEAAQAMRGTAENRTLDHPFKR